MLPVLGEHLLCIPTGKRRCRLQQRWSDRWFLGVTDRRSDFYVGTALGVVRTQSLRRRPAAERANPELLDKLIGVPWQPGPSDLDSTAVPTAVSAEPAAMNCLSVVNRHSGLREEPTSDVTLNCAGMDTL